MKIGLHVSMAGGVFKAPGNAASLGCETFQIFSRSPRGGKPPELTKETVTKFREEMDNYRFTDFYIHTPYYINLASNKPSTSNYSQVVIQEEIERGDKLGATAVMTHLGSAKDMLKNQALKQTAKLLKKTLDKTKKLKTELLIEMSAGSGQIIGDTFEELKEIRNLVGEEINFCYDTAHGFASGYDLRTSQEFEKVWQQFDRILGLESLKLVHVNDSLVPLDSKKDRHADIGDGEIGLPGFKKLVQDKRFENVDFILETPGDNSRRKRDVVLLKKLRDQKKS